MRREIPREEVVSFVSAFVNAVANGEYRMMMGYSGTDQEYSGCSYFGDMMRAIKNSDARWSQHSWPENLIVPEFQRQAKAHEGIRIIPRQTSILSGFNYYERDPNAPAVTAVSSPVRVLEKA